MTGHIVIANEIEIPDKVAQGRPVAGSGGKVVVRSNSSVASFLFYVDHGVLNFTVSGPVGTSGYVNITLNKRVVDGQPIVTIDNMPVSITVKGNETHYEIYFEYAHSTHQVAVYGTEMIPIPEFGLAMTTFLALTLIATQGLLRRSKKEWKKRL